jgi:hypothetical protein
MIRNYLFRLDAVSKCENRRVEFQFNLCVLERNAGIFHVMSNKFYKYTECFRCSCDKPKKLAYDTDRDKINTL